MRKILDITQLIINISLICGIIGVFISYWRLKILEEKIEKKHLEFENSRNLKRKQPIPLEFVESQIHEERKQTEEALAPLNRKRERIISKIPFLK